MARMYGKPTKFVRHIDDESFTVEPQRAYLHVFWKHSNSATARTDGQDLNDEKVYPQGSKILRHKLDILVTPETIEPQQVYMGRVKLSWHDIYSPYVCGLERDDTAYQTQGSATSRTSYLQLFPDVTNEDCNGEETLIDTSGIDQVKMHDNVSHFLNLKKVTVFDQRPLMGERWQRIPSKVKRINPYTLYGLWIFNDSDRGATPADTQVTFKIKSYIEEMAL